MYAIYIYIYNMYRQLPGAPANFRLPLRAASGSDGLLGRGDAEPRGAAAVNRIRAGDLEILADW